jgi:hypothetical protein
MKISTIFLSKYVNGLAKISLKHCKNLKGTRLLILFHIWYTTIINREGSIWNREYCHEAMQGENTLTWWKRIDNFAKAFSLKIQSWGVNWMLHPFDLWESPILFPQSHDPQAMLMYIYSNMFSNFHFQKFHCLKQNLKNY